MPHASKESKAAYQKAYKESPIGKEKRRAARLKYAQHIRKNPPIRDTKFNTQTIAQLLRNWSTP